MRCQTFGNCGYCYSSGPLGGYCPRCSEREDASLLRLNKLRFSALLWGIAGGRIFVDAELLARSYPEARIFPVDNDRRVHWWRTPPCERNFYIGELRQLPEDYQNSYRESLRELGEYLG